MIHIPAQPDEEFRATACQDERHQVLLFQAFFNALVVSALGEHRIRILPATYNCPYNLYSRVPEERRALALNDLICFTIEDSSVNPDAVADIKIREPLRSWLGARVALG